LKNGKRKIIEVNGMAKLRVRQWAKRYLDDNGPSTTEQIASHIEDYSTIGVKSMRSLGSILNSTPGIVKCGRILTRNTGGTYYVNQWRIRQKEDEKGDE
tara:strand:+ start:690 stop:986 length:297 start_codon:yes stop_codon:yes gene_type:complete